MCASLRFTLAGGDRRLAYTAKALRDKGCAVRTLAGEKDDDYGETDVLLLPVPLSRDGQTLHAPRAQTPIALERLAEITGSETRVFCGMPGNASALFFRRGIRLYDYAAREEFALRNAVPTAEGVAQLLLCALPRTVRGSHILITGCGRTARACARLLYGMGARITIAARRCSALAFADGEGYHGLYLRELDGLMDRFDAVVNTVPAPVLTASVLEGMPKRCPIIEIASAPYGVDFEAAKRLGLAVQIAPSLPGKVAPQTAGIIIAETVLNMLMEGNTCTA